ncbi:class I SAM-dependent methyltransferase [Curtobacterium caseinilyticum]|uniref:Class I SAM-dependent methyltransferase n=1 Tax=Curtobacterium caseinilyticum TaxID=3055137 RepID=A0ABT7TUB1_9MICO|nr:class I SAM-dependent methyltransferase [Curtobacterium caseinilyticum]MDM7893180.1 class I SAM-dependent methyltransferase [Curtobacterium caseinilyticum]
MQGDEQLQADEQHGHEQHGHERHGHEQVDAPDRTTAASAQDWWEARYAERDGIWSGRVNDVLAGVAADLPRGGARALDLGCGEGGDVVWLAEHGWTATGVDLSSTAVARAALAAEVAGVADRTAFVAADLGTWEPAAGARFDLVTASFLQSWPVEIPRDEILRRATGFVAPGGHLLVTAHAAPPHADLPEEFRSYRFPSPEQDLAALRLDDGWEVLVAEGRPRTSTGRDGERHETVDSVVLVRRAPVR